MIDRKTLLEPPFAADPPVKLNINAKTLGLILAILGAIAALFGLLGVPILLGLSSALGFGGIFTLAIIGVIVSLIGTIIGTWGGYQMYQGKRDGKLLVIYGLIINVIGSLLAAIGGSSGGFVGWVFGALVSFVIYYLVVISRFPDEPAPVDSSKAASV